MAMEPRYEPDPGDWVCARCGVPLEQVRVQVGYLGSAFDVSLPRCPSCGLTMIPKSLAEGKMAEVEALLEDKWSPSMSLGCSARRRTAVCGPAVRL